MRDFGDAARAASAGPSAAMSRATPPGTTASIISRWPKQASAARKHALAQDAGLRMHEREGSIVADGADVAEMIGQPFQLGHQRAQIDRARRRLHLQCGFDGLGEGEGISDRAVARGARGELGGLLQRRAAHQRLDALVHITEPLLQPHHVLAIGGEAEMAGLDDAGMHGPDRNLMQRLAFGGEERVGRRRLRRLRLSERMRHIPEAEIEPRPRVGRADRFVSEQAADGAFEPDGGGMPGADARETCRPCRA